MASSSALVCVKAYEQVARELLSKQAWAYYSAGADEETTLNECNEAYKRYCFILIYTTCCYLNKQYYSGYFSHVDDECIRYHPVGWDVLKAHGSRTEHRAITS